VSQLQVLAFPDTVIRACAAFEKDVVGHNDRSAAVLFQAVNLEEVDPERLAVGRRRTAKLCSPPRFSAATDTTTQHF